MSEDCKFKKYLKFGSILNKSRALRAVPRLIVNNFKTSTELNKS